MSAIIDIKQIKIGYAIQSMADLVIPRGTKNKVLLVPVRMSVMNFDKRYSDEKEFLMVLYRPMNYCFVGFIDTHSIFLDDGCDVHYETYHDSCWRDGVDRIIKKESSKVIDLAMDELGEDIKKLHVHNSFGISGPKVVDAMIEMDSSNRTAKFKKIKNE